MIYECPAECSTCATSQCSVLIISSRGTATAHQCVKVIIADSVRPADTFPQSFAVRRPRSSFCFQIRSKHNLMNIYRPLLSVESNFRSFR
jgi:hypothetical protein